MIDLLCLLLYPALLIERGGWWVVFAPVTVLALVVDCLANFTTLSIITGDGFPRKGEWTFSTRLERLCKDFGPDQQLYIQIAKKLNRIAPNHNHIKAVL